MVTEGRHSDATRLAFFRVLLSSSCIRRRRCYIASSELVKVFQSKEILANTVKEFRQAQPNSSHAACRGA